MSKTCVIASSFSAVSDNETFLSVRRVGLPILAAIENAARTLAPAVKHIGKSHIFAAIRMASVALAAVLATAPIVTISVRAQVLPGTRSALVFYQLTPCRLVDTRGASGPLGGPTLAAEISRDFPLQSSNCGIPSGAIAYSLNVTAVPDGSLGYLTIWPTGQDRPLVSTLNAPTGAITANAAIVPAGTNGDVSVYVTNASDVILDVDGYFAPPGNTGLSYIYSNASLSGTYTVTMFSSDGGSIITPETFLGILDFDGDGNITSGTLNGASTTYGDNVQGTSGTTTNCPLSVTGKYSIASTALGTATLSFTGSSVSSGANADGIQLNGCLLVPPQISIGIGVAQQGSTLVFQMAPGVSNVNFWGSGSKQ
jgi:hypothetical protein